MKKNLFIYCFIVCLFCISAKPIPYKVMKQSDREGTGFFYALPKHKLSIKITVKQTEHVRGIFSGYADMLLGMENAIKESTSSYSIENVEIISTAIVDENQMFFINSGDDKINITYGTGMLINSVEMLKGNAKKNINTEVRNNIEQCEAQHFSDKTYSNVVNNFNMDIIPSAITLLESAQLMQKRLKEIDGHKQTLVTSITEIPYTGGAFRVLLDVFDKEKSDILLLFKGFTNTYYTTYYFDVVPEYDKIKLTNFDTTLGITTADNASALNLCIDKNINVSDTVNTGGFAYKMPSYSQISLEHNDNVIYKKNMILSQFCETYYLPLLYGKIMFAPCDGGVKTILNFEF